MSLTSFQIGIYIIFIIFIIIISEYYTTTTTPTTTLTKTTNQSKKEEFTVEDDTIKSDVIKELNNLNISDLGIQNNVASNILSFNTILNKYKVLDVPININNKGTICDKWGMYSNGKYRDHNNNCINIKNDNQCYKNGILESCSNYYNDAMYKLMNLNTEEMLQKLKYNIFSNIININNIINNKNDEANKLINEIKIKYNLEIQQKYFIDYNNKNLDSKKILIDKTSKNFEKTENDVNINKIEFQQFLKMNKKISEQNASYYSYIIYLIVSIIIVGLLNFFFTELL